MKNNIKSVVRHVLFAGYYFYSMVAVPITYNRAFKNGELSYLSKEDFEVWKRSMLTMLKEYCSAGYNFRVRQVVYTFANSKVEVVRKTSPCAKENPIIVLCIKNDLQRVKMLVDHYRNLGVDKFAFMDNGSDDGTFEWLMEQSDIDLFRCYEPYQTAVKEGWINRIISHYGFDRWYIVTDSDELCTYVGMETHPIQDVTRLAERKGIKRIKGLTLDMYADGQPFGNTDDIRRDYCWMDYDTYFVTEVQAGKTKFNAFLGGPRYRLMNSRITLSKFPLVYWERGTISDSAHFQYPHNNLPEYECYIGIQHFKFIDKDLDVYRKRAKGNSGFSSGGLMYKQYMDYVEKTGSANFMYEDSVRFNGSEALKKVPLISDIGLDS